jgi:hypothetical protein
VAVVTRNLQTINTSKKEMHQEKGSSIKQKENAGTTDTYY